MPTKDSSDWTNCPYGHTVNSHWVSDWIDRMASEYGGIVRGHGREWDWGQALCVEQYGLNPDAWPSDPSDTDIQVAAIWEEGNLPDWIDNEPRPTL